MTERYPSLRRELARIYQIFYDAQSQNALDPDCLPFFNSTPSKLFETTAIVSLLEQGAHLTTDYFGVFSWKFFRKIPLRFSEIYQRITADQMAADVYSFFGAVREVSVWSSAERRHPGIIATAEAVFAELGLSLDLASLPTPIIYQNHFLARSELWQRYFLELLNPAVEVLLSPPKKLKRLLSRKAHYDNQQLSPNELIQLFGTPYMTLEPFIAERLFATWLASAHRQDFILSERPEMNHPISVKQIWDGRFVEETNLAHEPSLSHLRHSKNCRAEK